MAIVLINHVEREVEELKDSPEGFEKAVVRHIHDMRKEHYEKLEEMEENHTAEMTELEKHIESIERMNEDLKNRLEELSSIPDDMNPKPV